ncbi:MAG TPA: type II toxin-antitoxin system death-on-curing family toxin [Chloroflexota bacterium]|nr:type II toxin-antitoxin system death-on-curing family toxin [Chloroflexota bacterium]
MPDEPTQSLAELILKVDFSYPFSVDFTATDSESVQEIVRRLTDAAFAFNLLAVTEFGGRSGRERENGLVSSKIGNAFQTWGGQDLHPDPFEKAAVLIEGIVHGHPFEDGNKRTGFLLTFFYLQQIGYPPVGEFPEGEVVDFCLDLSKGLYTSLDAVMAEILIFWGYIPISEEDDIIEDTSVTEDISE